MADEPSLETLRRRACDCTACELYKRATQTVFGSGPADARLMLVGEQPGDREDLEGRPFVGPAGQVLDKALALAGIDRRQCYLTNAVKHFKWEPRGKRRLHKTPAQREIDACRRWLIAEIQALQPEMIVCLGATAAKAIFGADFRVTLQHGRVLPTPCGPRGLATTHPSAILRMADAAAREKALAIMVEDLKACV